MAKHLYQAGNQYGKLGAGVPRPSSTTNFKTIIKAVLNSYTTEQIVEMFHNLDEEKQLYFINDMNKQQRDHYEKILKLKLERDRNLSGELSNNTIDIRLLGEGEDCTNDSE